MNTLYNVGCSEALNSLGLGHLAKKMANVAKMPTALLKNTAMKTSIRPSSVPKNLGGSTNRGQSGMFGKFDKKPAKDFNPKRTIKGDENVGELPPISIRPGAITD